jgi:tRNA A-37 threonylcarbamoyl transferase component Bud32
MMKKLSIKDYENIITNSSIIVEDQYGPTLLKLSNGNFAKLFRIKKVLSSAWIYPRSKRFVLNANKLEKLNIPTVKVIDFYKINDIKQGMVIYEPIKGVVLREALSLSNDKKDMIKLFAHFLADIHHKGVYFKALDFGNVICIEDNTLGLIDIDNMFFSKGFLPFKKRIKNLNHIFHYKEDIKLIKKFGISFFLHAYNERALLPIPKLEVLIAKANELCEI